METLSMTPAHRPHAQQTYGRVTDAVAWRAPTAQRFDSRPANDSAPPEPTIKDMAANLPAWVTVVGGGLIAALMGAMVGGALQI